VTNVEKFFNNLFHFFIVFVLLFMIVAAGNIIVEGIRHDHERQHKIDCPDYPPVDGAGRPEVCK